MGVIYNANVVDEADTGSWDLMWNPKYAGNILQYNNARDALGTAMYRAGIDVNTTDHAAWKQALQALAELTGRTMREDLLNRIFARFCVGK